jgi:flagellar protein FliS
MTYPNYRSTAYHETLINTSSPTKLVVMLYQGAIRFLRQGVDDITSKNLGRKAQSIDRAVAIIQHLQSTLDFSSGKGMAEELDRIYTYSLERILAGSTKLDTAPLEEAIKLLSTLLSGWEEIATKESEMTVPAGVLASQATTGHFNLHA